MCVFVSVFHEKCLEKIKVWVFFVWAITVMMITNTSTHRELSGTLADMAVLKSNPELFLSEIETGSSKLGRFRWMAETLKVFLVNNTGGYFFSAGCAPLTATFNLPLSHSKSWFTVRNLQWTWVFGLFPKVMPVNRSHPICPTVSPWKSGVSVFYTLHSSRIQESIVLTCISPLQHPPPLPLLPSCSPWPDLHCAGSGSRAAGEAAGAFSRREGYRDRTSRDGSPVLPRG